MLFDRYIRTLLSISVVFVSACGALGCQSTDLDKMGYVECETDEDCEPVGICKKGKAFNYCVFECRIDKDCLPIAEKRGKKMICYAYECIVDPEGGDEDQAGPAGDADTGAAPDGDAPPGGDSDIDADGEVSDIEAEGEVSDAEAEGEVSDAEAEGEEAELEAENPEGDGESVQ